MHAAQLLTDDELYSLEDIIADGCESAADGEGGDDRVTVGKMIALSEPLLGGRGAPICRAPGRTRLPCVNGL